MTEQQAPKGHGGRREGAGRKPVSGQPLRRATVWLTEEQRAQLLAFGGGKLSAGIRRLYDEFFGSAEDA